MYIYARSGQEHIVTQSIVVAIQNQGSQRQILGFTGFGLTTKMAPTLLTAIPTVSLTNLRYVRSTLKLINTNPSLVFGSWSSLH